MRRTIAVVAGDDPDRDQLIENLLFLGYEPRRCPSLVGAGGDLVVVLVGSRADVHLLAGLATYQARVGRQRNVIVIAREPELVRRLVPAEQAAALLLLIPPVLLGQLGDALREAGSASP